MPWSTTIATSSAIGIMPLSRSRARRSGTRRSAREHVEDAFLGLEQQQMLESCSEMRPAVTRILPSSIPDVSCWVMASTSSCSLM
jgi:hypothetical protein